MHPQCFAISLVPQQRVSPSDCLPPSSGWITAETESISTVFKGPVQLTACRKKAPRAVPSSIFQSPKASGRMSPGRGEERDLEPGSYLLGEAVPHLLQGAQHFINVEHAGHLDPLQSLQL